MGLGRDLGCWARMEFPYLCKFYHLPDELYDYPEGEPPQFHWFGYYRPWHPMENFYYAQEHCGFEPNPERSEGTYTRFASLDDKLDGLHYFLGYAKFGIG